MLAGHVKDRQAGFLDDLVGSSNWLSLESWETSPVWMMKSGLVGRAAILATASR
jgi:hypothetical protein